MKLKKYASLAGVLVIFAMPAAAAGLPDIGVSRAYNDCMTAKDAAQGVITAMLGCTERELTVQNIKLSETYDILLASSDADQKPKLAAAQNTWAAFRDANCEAKNSSGETDDLVGRADCLLQMTMDRTKELQDLLDND